MFCGNIFFFLKGKYLVAEDLLIIKVKSFSSEVLLLFFGCVCWFPEQPVMCSGRDSAAEAAVGNVGLGLFVVFLFWPLVTLPSPVVFSFETSRGEM